MRKKLFLLFLSLMVTPLLFAQKDVVAVANDRVEIQIDTKIEDGKKVEGTENLVFTIYDLTKWRHSSGLSEKAAKEFLLDKDGTKQEMQEFIQKEQLQKINEEPIVTESNGIASTSVARYQGEKDAAYLIIASGETKKYQFVPIVLFLPQYYVNSESESSKIIIYGKYFETKEVPTTASSEKIIEKRPTVKPVVAASSKAFPQTNDTNSNYLVVGCLFIILGIIGIERNTKKNRGRK